MRQLNGRVLFWAPRVLSIAFIGFISLFALDVFQGGHSLRSMIGALFMHLIPSFVLIAVLIAAWRWEWVGAVLYGAAGLLYVLMILPRPSPPPAMKLIWCLTIAAPAFLVAALFLMNWIRRAELHAGVRGNKV